MYEECQTGLQFCMPGECFCSAYQGWIVTRSSKITMLLRQRKGAQARSRRQSENSSFFCIVKKARDLGKHFCYTVNVLWLWTFPCKRFHCVNTGVLM